MVSEEIVRKYNLEKRAVKILSGGEASYPLFDNINDYKNWNSDFFSCKEASKIAYKNANLTVKDINYFGLYDCFPICFLEALEGVGICNDGEGGIYIENTYNNYTEYNPSKFPINTHGGLLSFGAPWEGPAIYSIIECVSQLREEAKKRQM